MTMTDWSLRVSTNKKHLIITQAGCHSDRDFCGEESVLDKIDASPSAPHDTLIVERLAIEKEI
jgi:hypothetical protein